VVQPASYSKGIIFPSSDKKDRSVKLTTSLLLVSMLRMSGGMRLLPLYAFMVWTGAILHLKIRRLENPRNKYCTILLLLLLLLAFTTHLQVLASSFLRFRDHTQWHTTVGRTPLDEWSARRRDLYLTTHTTLTTDKHPCPRWDLNPQSQQASRHTL
jgi:hypothetical protein